MAGGTGIAPVKAILEELINREDPRDVYIYWGMPSSEGFYLESLDIFSKEKKVIFTSFQSYLVKKTGRGAKDLFIKLSVKTLIPCKSLMSMLVVLQS